MVKGDLSLSQRKKKRGCLQPGLGKEDGKRGKHSWTASTWLGTAAPREVLTGGGGKTCSKRLDSSPTSSHPP